MKLVVGLGNPGRAYEGTRHNIGWEVLDLLAVRLGWTTGTEQFNRLARSRHDGLVLDGSADAVGVLGQRMMLLKPTTYMNNSGRAVQSAMAFYQMAPVDILVVLDDMALACGRIRLRAGGSSGGHNGLRDVERMIGTQEYARLRIGIDAPPQRMPWRDYVLTRFDTQQRRLVDEAVDRAVNAVTTWMGHGIVAAMNQYNAEEGKNKQEGPGE
jgi:PTH1 family peptidyl-tRNA hydrolase